MGKIATFKKIDENKLYQVLIFLILMLVIFSSYFFIRHQLDKRFNMIKDDFSWVYQVDKIAEEEGKLVLSGWAFQLKRNSTAENCELILYNTETGKAYYPEMNFFAREDVNSYFLCEYDYTDSGFSASISAKKLDLENSVYEILLRPAGERNAYQTGIYYANGKMMFANPKEFVPLETAGTDLERVTEEGVLRVYRPDFGIYVYQYEGELYWIAEETYGFVDGDSYVQFQMDTTQIDKLPEKRLANNWFWSNIGFYFKSNELIDWDTGNYRVAKCALPTEYSITKIWTGNYIEDWIWMQYFRPFYDFSEAESYSIYGVVIKT
ncbi:MAG: hypothetical protein ACI4FZ_08305 [Lachnospiraceae bacterium]